MKKESYKSKDYQFKAPSEKSIEDHTEPEEAAEPEEVVEKELTPSSHCLSQDFRKASRVARHVEKLSDEEKKSFAAKYGIPYKDVSEIRGNARQKFWDS